MYNILTGKQRALVFPVMCNADVEINYAENIPDSAEDEGYGIWSHTGDFTFEAILTPYDINGAPTATLRGRTVSNSKKIMPNAIPNASSLRNSYLGADNIVGYDMRIFSSTNFYIGLKNNTITTFNQPSEYKIVVGIKLSSGAVQEFVTDNAVILPSRDRSWVYSTSGLSNVNQEGRIEYELATFVNDSNGSAWASGDTEIPVLNQNLFTTLNEGEPLFIKDGFTFTQIGTIDDTDTSGNTITLASAYNAEFAHLTALYVRTYQDPTYINNSFHIACTYDETAKEAKIYFNGLLVKAGTHAQSGTFSFAKENLYIGANGLRKVGNESAIDNQQFMGEMHEMCMTSVIRRRFPSIVSLLPNYNDTLFYFRFEEVDLWH